MSVKIFKQDENIMKNGDAFTIENNQEKVVEVLKKEEE